MRNDDRGTVTVEVELTEALVELIRGVFGDVDLDEFAAGAVEMHVRRELMNDKSPLPVKVPDHVAYRAELLAEHHRVAYDNRQPQLAVDQLSEIADIRYKFPEDRSDD